jgi:hypothetical protein
VLAANPRHGPVLAHFEFPIQPFLLIVTTSKNGAIRPDRHISSTRKLGARVAVDGIKFTGRRVQFEERFVSGGESPRPDRQPRCSSRTIQVFTLRQRDPDYRRFVQLLIAHAKLGQLRQWH